jgi:hypothetical protein
VLHLESKLVDGKTYSDTCTISSTHCTVVLELESKLVHGETYYVTVTAVNAVGLQSYAFSGPVRIDSTPPTYGAVVELSSAEKINVTNHTATAAMNAHVCTTLDGQ